MRLAARQMASGAAAGVMIPPGNSLCIERRRQDAGSDVQFDGMILFLHHVPHKKLSYCWETVRHESMPRIAEMDVEMTT